MGYRTHFCAAETGQVQGLFLAKRYMEGRKPLILPCNKLKVNYLTIAITLKLFNQCSIVKLKILCSSSLTTEIGFKVIIK